MPLVGSPLILSGGVIVNQAGSPNTNFRVETGNKTHAMFVDSGDEKIFFLSGSGVTGADGKDVAFFVSGAVGAKDRTWGIPGASVFAGDVVTSGSLTSITGLSGSLTTLTNGTSYLIAGSNVTITSASNGSVTVASTGGGGVDGSGAATRLAYWSDTDTLTSDADLTWDGTTLYANSAGTTLNIQGDTNLNGTVVINQSGADKDFRVETQNKSSALEVQGSTDQVLLFSGSLSDSAGVGSSPLDPDPRTFVDTNFYVSGAIGSRNTAIRGTSVFGGDVVHSGSVIILDPGGTDENLKLVRGPSGNNYVTFEEDTGVNVGQIYANSSNLFIKGSSSGNDIIFRVGSSNVLRMDGTTARIGIGNNIVTPAAMLHVSGTDPMAFRVDSGTRSKAIMVDGEQVLILSGGSATSYNEAAATDVNFYVSGTIGGKHRHTGVSIFGGDLVASGTIFSENGLRVDTPDELHALFVSGPEVVFFKEHTPGTDTNWFVSGSVGGKGSTNTATFGGDVFISGAIYHENPLPIHTVNTGYGDIVTIGNSSVTAGKLYYYKDTGWTEVDAADVADGASQLLGIALGTNSHHGMIVRGFAQLNITGLSSGDEGKPVYVDKTGGGGTGKITVTPPAAPGDFVRLLGWLTDDGDGGSDASIYFSPSQDWIEL